MILVCIDIGKNGHMFCVMNQSSGEILVDPSSFKNNKEGFELLIKAIELYPKANILIGMKDIGHYHFNLLKYLLDAKNTVTLIDSITTNLTRKTQLSTTKDDDLNTLPIGDVLASGPRRKGYHISNVNTFDLYEQKRLTREHHDLKEQKNAYTNKLQKCIDIVFPEFNS